MGELVTTGPPYRSAQLQWRLYPGRAHRRGDEHRLEVRRSHDARAGQIVEVTDFERALGHRSEHREIYLRAGVVATDLSGDESDHIGMFHLKITQDHLGCVWQFGEHRRLVETDEVAASVAFDVADGAAPELCGREEGGHGEAGLVDPETGVYIGTAPEVLDLVDEALDAIAEGRPGDVEELAGGGVGQRVEGPVGGVVLDGRGGDGEIRANDVGFGWCRAGCRSGAWPCCCRRCLG